MTIIPFGLVLGFSITALPYLLTRQGLPLDKVAPISATVFSPTVYAFLLKPLLDTGFTRKTYSWVLLVVGALAFTLGMSFLDPWHLKIAVPSLLIATLSMVLYTGAVNGWLSATTVDSERGAVGGWYNVANLGAGALGSFVVMSLLTRGWVTQREVALGLGVAVLLGGIPLLFMPDPKPAAFRLTQVVTETPKAIWRAVKRRECLVGFALLLAVIFDLTVRPTVSASALVLTAFLLSTLAFVLRAARKDPMVGLLSPVILGARSCAQMLGVTA